MLRSLMICLSLLCFLAEAARAEDSAQIPVAEVGGTAITLRQIEDATLTKEGAELIEDWVRQNLDHLRWSDLKDDDVIVQIGFNRITRRELADSLLRKGVGAVRDDLIELALVRQAIAKAGIVLSDDDIARTYRRQEQKFHQDIARKGETRIDFASFLRSKYQMTPQEFQQQPAMQVLTGLERLARDEARNEADDQLLERYLAEHLPRYRQVEAVDLLAIRIPYQFEPGAGGQPTISPQERERLLSVVQGIHRDIAQGGVPFGRAWALYGSAYDAEAKGGRVGWTGRDGRREQGDARSPQISPEGMTAAWAVTTFPALLPPIAHAEGVELLEVRAKRPAKEPVFADLRDRLRNDRIDETLDQRIVDLRQRIRFEGNVKRHSIPEAIQRLKSTDSQPQR